MSKPLVFDMTIGQAIQRFPKGFAVSPEGLLFEVIEAKKQPQDLPIAKGYLAVDVPVLKVGDEFYGHSSDGLINKLTPSEFADELDRLIKCADTIDEDEILSKLYQTYSEKLAYASKQLLNETP